MIRGRYLNLLPGIGVLLLLVALVVIMPGCTSAKRAEVQRVIEEAGRQEPGTTVTWIKGEETGEDMEKIEDPDGQWAVSATASSSYAQVCGTDRMSPEQATGPPDVDAMMVAHTAWGPSTENAGYEWLELTYQEPVHATGVRIHEVHGCGCVVMVQLKDTEGGYHLKWTGTTDEDVPFVNWLVLEFPPTSYLTKTVRVTLDTTRFEHWKQIDAVQLVGVP